MRFDILTLFPEFFPAVLNGSILGRAAEKGLLDFHYWNIRDYAHNKHNRVDDYPYGGGLGMVMQPQPIFRAYQEVRKQSKKRPLTLLLSPRGRVFNQKLAAQLAHEEQLVLLCGHYEGVDQRVIDEICDYELSVGDFVLTGGEIGAMLVCDAVARLIPGVLAQEESFTNESHYNGLLEYPQYTRPPVYHGQPVPEVLLSGHQKHIDDWRRARSLEITKEARPDLYAAACPGESSQAPIVQVHPTVSLLALGGDCEKWGEEVVAQCRKQGITLQRASFLCGEWDWEWVQATLDPPPQALVVCVNGGDWRDLPAWIKKSYTGFVFLAGFREIAEEEEQPQVQRVCEALRQWKKELPQAYIPPSPFGTALELGRRVKTFFSLAGAACAVKEARVLALDCPSFSEEALSLLQTMGLAVQSTSSGLMENDALPLASDQIEGLLCRLARPDPSQPQPVLLMVPALAGGEYSAEMEAVFRRLGSKGIFVFPGSSLSGALSAYLMAAASGCYPGQAVLYGPLPYDLYEGNLKRLKKWEANDFLIGGPAENDWSEAAQAGRRGTYPPSPFTWFGLQYTKQEGLHCYVLEGDIPDLAGRALNGLNLFACPGMEEFYRRVLLERAFVPEPAVCFERIGWFLAQLAKLLGIPCDTPHLDFCGDPAENSSFHSFDHSPR